MTITIIESNQNLSRVDHYWKDETDIVTTTITAAAAVCDININATVATAITTAEGEMWGQHCSGWHP